jgi:alpha-tubulin suppressor-like RCC1 family protein
MAKGDAHTVLALKNPAAAWCLFIWGRWHTQNQPVNDIHTPQAIPLPPGHAVTHIVIPQERHDVPVKRALIATESTQGTRLFTLTCSFGTNTPQVIPHDIPLSYTVTHLSSGDGYSLVAVIDDTGRHRLFAWGRNECGQLGVGNYDFQAGPAEVTHQYNGLPWVPPGHTIERLATGLHHSLALTQDAFGNQYLWAWGDNCKGQLGLWHTNSAYNSRPQSVVAQVHGTTLLPPGRRVTHLVAKDAHTLMATQDPDNQARLWGWGENWWSVLGLGNTEDYLEAPNEITQQSGVPLLPQHHAIIHLTLGGNHSVLVRADPNPEGNQEFWAWGANRNGELGGFAHSHCEGRPKGIFALNSIASVAAGGSDTAFVTFGPEFHIYTWGDNSHGALGIGPTTPNEGLWNRPKHDLVQIHRIFRDFMAGALAV